MKFTTGNNLSPRRKFPRSIFKKNAASRFPAASATSTPGRVNFSKGESTVNNISMTTAEEFSDSSMEQEREMHMRRGGAISKKRNATAPITGEKKKKNMLPKNGGGGKGGEKEKYQGYTMRTRKNQQD